jgi:hypothetical protein
MYGNAPILQKAALVRLKGVGYLTSFELSIDNRQELFKIPL